MATSSSDPKKLLLALPASAGGAAGSAPPPTPPSMKLLVDTRAGRVLYAEAGKDVADFIVSLPTLPPATVVNLLMGDAAPGNGMSVVEMMDDDGGAANTKLQLVPFVQQGAAAAEFTVADDLTVAPNLLSTISLLNSFGVKDIGALREKTVRLGRHEVSEILRVVHHSKTVLIDVFLAPPPPAGGGGGGKKKRKRRRRPSTSRSVE